MARVLAAAIALLIGALLPAHSAGAQSDVQLLPQPRRLVDTQTGSGYQGAGQPLGGLSDPRCFQVAGNVGVPGEAQDLVANVTGVGFSENGWVTLFPAGEGVPDTSTLNFDTDQNAVANLTMVPIGTDGQVCAVGQAGTHVILDVVGYTAPEPGQSVQLLPQPRRLVDTQPGSGYQGAGQPLSGLSTPRCFQVAGNVGVPTDATAVVANVTGVRFLENGWITLFPPGSAIPDTSTLNFDTDEYAIANLAMVPLGGGQVCAVGQAGAHLILDVVGYLVNAAPPVGLTCPSANTLDALQACILDQSGMRNRTGVYVVPGDAERAEFGAVVRAMLDGACASLTPGGPLAGVYHVARFTDTTNNKPYCVLMEVGDTDGNGKVDKGWGTFIVDPAAVRELNIAIAHPFDDARTQDQGLAIFRQTNSRSFLLAGARRDHGPLRDCPGDEDADPCPASDVAHNVDTMFFVVTQQLAAFYGANDWTQLQFHGNASCPATDIHMSYGVRVPLSGSDKLSVLKAELRRHNPTWLVTLFGEPGNPCPLNGTTNVEGQLLNSGQPNAPRRFIHIEQFMDAQRTDRRDPSNWIPALLDAFP